jgi:hypothetical protein
MRRRDGRQAMPGIRQCGAIAADRAALQPALGSLTSARVESPARQRSQRPKRIKGEESAMGSSIGRVLLMAIGGFAVVAISFFATMKILDYWQAPQDPNASVIHVVNATYGLACKDFVPPLGNVTAALTSACDKAKTTCLFVIDAVQIGDPANDCAKDFVANWRCGSDPTVHQFYLTPEANGRSAVLSCPAP